MPFHPALLEHYLPQVPPAPRRVEAHVTPTSLPRERERERKREQPLYSEGEESDGGERSEGRTGAPHRLKVGDLKKKKKGRWRRGMGGDGRVCEGRFGGSSPLC